MPRARNVAADPGQVTAPGFENVALVLQGGGALGSYQAGVYQGLFEHGIEPNWVAGISIGAINSAIIAGNAPDDRIANLRKFWELASAGTDLSRLLMGLPLANMIQNWVNLGSAFQTVRDGIPGFFVPRFPPPFLIPPGMDGSASWYDTAPLRDTLLELVDFDRINASENRFSVGAVNVESGNFRYFDNSEETIGPDHIMASGALPPGFPAVEIGGEYYWDGGLVSNTPLDWIIAHNGNRDTLVFQVDLWSARGHVPRDLNEVAVRQKEIQYSSRTRASTDRFRELQKVRSAYSRLFEQLPQDLKDSPEAQMLAERSSPARYNIAHLIYTPSPYEGQTRDFEFSRKTMEEHWDRGYEDATRTLAHPQVTKLPEQREIVRIFDFTSFGKKDD